MIIFTHYKKFHLYYSINKNVLLKISYFSCEFFLIKRTCIYFFAWHFFLKFYQIKSNKTLVNFYYGIFFLLKSRLAKQGKVKHNISVDDQFQQIFLLIPGLCKSSQLAYCDATTIFKLTGNLSEIENYIFVTTLKNYPL